MSEPKILVATPNYTNLYVSEVHQNHLECAVTWTKMGIKFNWLVTGRTFVHFARTQACEVALLCDYTHILWLDDDAIIDPQLLPKYLAFDKEVVITPYFMRRPPFECGVLKSTSGDFHDHPSYRNLTMKDLHQGLIEVDGGGTHAMLIKTSTLRTRGDNTSRDACDPSLKALIGRLSDADKLVIDHNVGSLPDESLTMEEENEQGRSYFIMPKSGTEDMLWCYRAKRKGIKIWCDTDATSGHVGFAPIVTEAFRAQTEALIASEKGEAIGTHVVRVLPHDISAGTEFPGVSSARHEAIDLSKASSLI